MKKKLASLDRKVIGVSALLLATTLLYNNCGRFSADHIGKLSTDLGSEAPIDPKDPGTKPPSPAPAPSPPPPPPPVIPGVGVHPDYRNTPLGQIVHAMTPGTWHEIQGVNKIKDVFPPHHAAWAVQGPSCVVRAWSGGAVGEGKLYVWGGGHNDYGGNEVYNFDLTTFTWTRMNDPSMYQPNCPNDSCVTVDGTPTSVHSYDAIEWLPNVRRLWMGPGAIFRSGNATSQAFFFDVFTTTWQKRTNLPGGAFGATDYDPVTGYLIVVADSGWAVAYDPLTDTYKHTGSSSWFHGDGVGAFDFHNRQFVLITGHTPYIYDLSQLDLQNPNSAIPWNKKLVTYTMTGSGKVEFAPNKKMGFQYDPVRKIFVGWHGDRNVWILDPNNGWVWSEYKNINGPAPQEFYSNGEARTLGVYGRWRYLPEYDAYLGYNDVDGNVWIYKMP